MNPDVMARMTQAHDDLLTTDDAGVPVSTYPAEVREAAGVLSVQFGVSREVAIALLETSRHRGPPGPGRHRRHGDARAPDRPG